MPKHTVSFTAAGERRLQSNEPLGDAIASLVADGEYLLIDPAINAQSYVIADEDDYTYSDVTEGLLPYLPFADRVRAYEIMNLPHDDVDNPPTPRPTATIYPFSQDGLFDGAKVEYSFPETTVSRLILSGAAALELYQKYPDVLVDSNTGSISLDSCRFAGAALAVALQKESPAYSRGILDMPYPSFSLKDTSGSLDVYVGADHHGDFRLAMQRKAHGVPVDQRGMPLDFYLGSPEVAYLGAYHSTEPDFMRDILQHILRLPNKDEMADLMMRIVTDTYATVAHTTQSFGNFGDAGFGDGIIEALSLAYTATGDAQNRPRSYMITPDRKDYLMVTSQPGGVTFAPGGEGHELFGDQELHIPNSELPLMVGALISQALQGMGRTGVKAHLNILNVAHRLASGESPEAILSGHRRQHYN